MIDAELVGHQHIFVILDAAGHPVVTADRFQPPDLIGITEGNAVGFIGAILFQQLAQADDTFPGRMDVGQDQGDQVFFTQPAGYILLTALFGLPVDNIGISAEDAGVGCDGFGGSHGHVGGVDAAGGPDAVGLIDARAGGIAQRIVRKFDFQVADHAFILSRLLFGLNDNQFFDIEEAVIVSGNHGAAVVAGFSADQNCSTGHVDSSISDTVYFSHSFLSIQPAVRAVLQYSASGCPGLPCAGGRAPGECPWSGRFPDS